MAEKNVIAVAILESIRNLMESVFTDVCRAYRKSLASGLDSDAAWERAMEVFVERIEEFHPRC